jgi:hypothetical protein
MTGNGVEVAAMRPRAEPISRLIMVPFDARESISLAVAARLSAKAANTIRLWAERYGIGRKIGIEIGFGREGRARTRIIRISTTEPPSPETGGAQPSASSAPSADPPKPIPANGFAAAGLRRSAMLRTVVGVPMVRSSTPTR